MLAHLPEAVAVVAADRTLLWENGRLADLLGEGEAAPAPGSDLYAALGVDDAESALLRSVGCPVAAVAAAGNVAVAENVLHAGDRYFALTARPLPAGDGASGGERGGGERGGGEAGRAVVTVRDVSGEVLNRQKLDAIRQAGEELGDLTPEELPEMTLADRVELLRGKVLQVARDLMAFDVVEIRLLDQATGDLRPLLSVGMGEGVAELPLRADTAANGATGLVAATGEPYLCHDTAKDPHYLPGAPGARSALTVPLKLGEQVLGTLNIESGEPAAFDEDDVRFASLFAREIAAALHTLELLVAEKDCTARESTDRTLREVVGPVDEILQDSAWLLEKYIGHHPEMAERLKRVLARSREIKSLIARVGEELRPDAPHAPRPAAGAVAERPALVGARVLVADDDPHVRTAAHTLLGRRGCEVETAHDAAEALLMARSFPYDAALVDIRLPAGEMPPGRIARTGAGERAHGDGADGADPGEDDPSRGGGYECFQALRAASPALPVIFMTGFGYDPTHSIVKARREGLHGVLYKPFRPEQLLGEVESAVA